MADTRFNQIIAILESGSPFDYDELRGILAEHDGEEFDLFVRLSYELSTVPLSDRQARTAAKLIANLALNVFTFNLSESDTQNESAIEAASEAYQLAA